MIFPERMRRTPRFSVEGTDYEIDLSADNAAELRETLRSYADKGRRLRGPFRFRGRQCHLMSRKGTQKIRSWATENGYDPNPRGRLPSPCSGRKGCCLS
jgi:hypothetical protein